MNDLDRKIRESPRAEDAELFEEFGEEPSLFEMAMELFRGRNRWLIVLTMFWTLVFIALSVFTAIKFFQAETTRDLLMWAVAFVISVMAVSMMKIWSWMEINRNFVTREIKRVELQIARLAARIKD